MSQGSKFGALLTRDTLGPVRLAGTNEERNNSESSLDPPSSHSSVRELGLAEERGLRSSFRVIPEQPYVHMDEDETDNETTDKATVKKVPVYTINDRSSDTPDYVTSGGNRTLFTNGGIHNFNASKVQENYDASKFSLAKSMRSELRKQSTVTNQLQDINVYESGKSEENLQEKKGNMLPKLAAFCLIVAIFIAGLVVLIYFKKQDEPEGERGKILIEETEEDEEERDEKYTCPSVEVNLRGVTNFNCSLRASNITYEELHSIVVTPPPYLNEGVPFILIISEKERNTTWSAYYDVHQNYYIVRVRGPKATCSTGGTYQLGFLNKENKTTYDTTVHITVKSEVLRVNVSLTQDKDKNETDFTLGCSTNSGCEQSFVDFFAEINKEEQYLRGVNFSCTITYNDYDGYSVSCIGNIPDYLMSQFERITCRPRSSLLDDLDIEELEDLEAEIELPECDLTKHCGYKCISETDYYVVSRERCDIFHRCYQNNVFTSYCAPGTFFDPDGNFCACRHTTDLPWCQANGALKKNSDITKKLCTGG